MLAFILWSVPIRRARKIVAAEAPSDTADKSPHLQKRWRNTTSAALIAICLGAAAIEWPYYRMPRLDARGVERIYVIGDSISSGLGNEVTWPKMLADQRHIEVVNFAQAGCEVGGGMSQACRLEVGRALVLIELGGNDVMGYTTAARAR